MGGLFSFTGRFHTLKVERNRFTKAMNAAFKLLLLEAMREFIEAAAEKVPIFTGMARGSLRPLGRFVDSVIGGGLPSNLANIESHRDPRWKEYANSGKSLQAGEDLGAEAWTFKADGREVIVHFDIRVLHYALSEFANLAPEFPYREGNEPPWDSMEAGREAYRAYIAAHIRDRIPKLKDFMTRTEITIHDQDIAHSVKQAKRGITE